jgi:hypothetical protein
MSSHDLSYIPINYKKEKYYKKHKGTSKHTWSIQKGHQNRKRKNKERKQNPQNTKTGGIHHSNQLTKPIEQYITARALLPFIYSINPINYTYILHLIPQWNIS